MTSVTLDPIHLLAPVELQEGESLEVKFVGVPMAPNENEFKCPKIPGWKLVAATRAAFGAQLIYQRVVEQEGSHGAD